MAVFSPKIFKNMGGVSRVRRTPVQYKRHSQLPYYAIADIRVSLPPLEQLSGHYPELIDRLEKDWKGSLSSLNCNTGNFRQALAEGRVSLGHVWAEIFCLCLDYVSVRLGYGHIRFEEFFRHLKENEDCVEYRVRLFFSEPFPEEFGGLEYLVTGYLNAAILGHWFPIKRRLSEFVRYRSVSPFSLQVAPAQRAARPRRLGLPIARGSSPIINRGR